MCRARAAGLAPHAGTNACSRQARRTWGLRPLFASGPYGPAVFTCRFGQEVLRHAGADLHPCCETMARASGALLLSLSPSLLLSNTNISTSTLPPPSSTPTPSPTPPVPCSVAFRKLGQTKPLGRVGALRGSVFVFITGNTFPSDQKKKAIPKAPMGQTQGTIATILDL